MNIENFEIGGLETPEEEERVIMGPSGSSVEPLIRIALKKYRDSSEFNIKYYVQVGDVKMLVERGDSEEGAKEKYNTLIKRK
jgi:hypothetical protein